MKITILNESFLSREHLKRLRKLGALTIYQSTHSERQAIKRLRGVDIAIADCSMAPLNRRVLTSVDRLKLLVLSSTGYDSVDLKAANERKIKVANAPGFSTDAVAEMTIALMFAVIRKIPLGDRMIRRMPFQIDWDDKNHAKLFGADVRGKTLGIIGLGRIGTRVAELGLGIGMKVIGYNRTPKRIKGVKMMDINELLKSSDVISINLALAPGLENIVSTKEFRLMKPTAILINTARGKFVSTDALYRALKSKKIAGAGLDVLADWSLKNPLIKLDSVVFSPHCGSSTKESLVNLADIIVKNIEAFVKGQPVNIVNE